MAVEGGGRHAQASGNLGHGDLGFFSMALVAAAPGLEGRGLPGAAARPGRLQAGQGALADDYDARTWRARRADTAGPRGPTGSAAQTVGSVGERWEMAGRRLRCRACRRETSITAGTIFEGTRKPLRTWFLAMLFVTSQKNGVSAWAAACPRPRQLRDLLDLAAQAAAGHGAARPRPPCRRDRGRRNLCGRPGRRQAGPCGREQGHRRGVAEQRGRGIGRIRLRRVKDVSAESLLASCKKPWSRGRQFTPTAGEATPGCRRPATAIRSR